MTRYRARKHHPWHGAPNRWLGHANPWQGHANPWERPMRYEESALKPDPDAVKIAHPEHEEKWYGKSDA